MVFVFFFQKKAPAADKLIDCNILPVLSFYQALLNFADGAVYWGWLGVFVGGIGMATAAAKLTEAAVLGSALAILFLPPLYGYFTKWMIIAAVDSTEG